LQPDHAAADHLGLVTNLVDCANHANRIRRIGEDGDDVRIGGLDRPHDRRKVGSRWRISLVVNDFEAGRVGVLARAFGAVYREF
jgi:hypothetical protein